MSSTVAGILQDNGDTGRTPNQKSNFDLSTAYKTTYRTATPLNTYNVEQTFLRQVDTSKGIVYSEDLPKLDYVSPTLRKQMLEGKDINLALLLYPKNEVPQIGLAVELSAPKDTRLEQCLTLENAETLFVKCTLSDVTSLIHTKQISMILPHITAQSIIAITKCFQLRLQMQ